MSDDDALDGEEGGYVPCPDLAASDDPADPDDVAVSGHGSGYVSAGDSASPDDGDDETAAMTGQRGGYVAAQCEEEACPGYPSIWETFDGRDTTASDPDSWGSTSRDAIPWGIQDVAGHPYAGPSVQKAWVAGGLAHFEEAYNSNVGPTVRAYVLAGPAIGTTDWIAVIRFRFVTDVPPGGGGSLNGFRETLSITGVGPVSPTTKFTRILGQISSFGAGSGLTVNVWYRFKFEYSHTLGLRREKLWIEGSGEPVSWDNSSPITIDMETNEFLLTFEAFAGSLSAPTAIKGHVVVDTICL